MDVNERYSFDVTWYDDVADLERPYILSWYLNNNDIEMIDVRNRRSFLKRSPYSNIKLSDLFVGNCVTIYSRQLKIVGYTNDFTKKHFENVQERTLAMIKPGMYEHIGHVISEITSCGLQIINLRMLQLSAAKAAEFYAEHEGKPFYSGLVEMMSSEPIVALELMGPSAISTWRQLMGPTQKAKAKMEAPNSIRAKYAKNDTYNAVHGSDSPTSAQREIEFFFGADTKWPATATYINSTLMVIHRHAFPQMGEVVTRVLDEGFNITDMQVFAPSKADASDFYEIYRGVHPEYQRLVDEMANGAILALEISGNNAQSELRELAGPADPAIAKVVAPTSLRAVYGEDMVMNAVHVTDLADEAGPEVKFWFKLMRE